MQLFDIDTEEIVYQYTRKQALEDGYQMQLEGEHAEMAQQVYKYPVFITHGVFSLIDEAVINPNWCNDFNGVLWDILWMSAKASTALTESLSEFKVIITGVGRKRYHKMLVQCGPIDIDDPSPALTIMLPSEY